MILNTHQKARLKFFLEWYDKAIQLQKEGYVIRGPSGEEGVLGKHSHAGTDYYGLDREEDGIHFGIFMVNTEYDEGLYTPIRNLRTMLAGYHFYKEVSVNIL